MGDPEVNLGGGGGRGPSVGRYGRGFPFYWWGFRGSHPRECWKNEAKRYNLECKSSLCNPFKLRCFSSKIAQNIYILPRNTLDIITLSVTDGPRRGDCKPISMQNSGRGVWGNFSLHKESTPAHPLLLKEASGNLPWLYIFRKTDGNNAF